jgi:hypothetical protein
VPTRYWSGSILQVEQDGLYLRHRTTWWVWDGTNFTPTTTVPAPVPVAVILTSPAAS